MKYSKILYMCADAGKFIKNININPCRNCKFFIPDATDIDFTSGYNRCSNFGVKNIVSDKIIFDYTDSCRNDESKCGLEGKFFEKEPNLYSKMVLHKIRTPLFKVLLFSGLWMVLLISYKSQ